jgi:hypothetical protein
MDRCSLAHNRKSDTGHVYNASAAVLAAINNTASKYAAHPSLVSAENAPISAGAGFLLGFVIGVKR